MFKNKFSFLLIQETGLISHELESKPSSSFFKQGGEHLRLIQRRDNAVK